jgi:2,4-didehydro-3-deoxy-L-rhamnonate hydrolase
MTVRLANAGGRAALLGDDGVPFDVERGSGGRLPSDPMAVTAAGEQLEGGVRLEACVPRPSKVFAIALNYRKHAEETGAEVPQAPSVFTKFPSCLAGPNDDVLLPSEFVDWEVELVVVIGRPGSRIAAENAYDHVAGYCLGQDFSERRVQSTNQGLRPQFSLGKSYDTFGPIGPAVVALEAIPEPDAVPLWCEVNGERVQDGCTDDLIFSVPELIARLSDVCTFEAGDIVFTGTPSGVGVARQPPRFLRPGDVVVSGADGIGTLTNRAVLRP